MGKLAFIFPGQGSQAVGMGKDFYENDERIKELFTNLDEWVGCELSSYILEGPIETLTLTYYAQPALLATSYSMYLQLQDKGIVPDYVAGHSLGEYTALVASGVMSIEEGVKAVHKRGLLMDEAVPAGEGAMAAILGMEKEKLEQIVAEVSEQVSSVGLANLNSKNQIVISGTKAGVEEAAKRAKEQGAKRAVMLRVSGPFHSELMKPAAEELKNTLEKISFNIPHSKIVSNVYAKEMEHESLKDNLVKQLYSPVRWYESIEYMIEQGVTTFVEVGSGSVLTGLVKQINRNVKVYSVSNQQSLEQFLTAYKEEEVC
ncbi:MAG: ACP S-malonyltransferase [Bacillaceae bacterium]